jgi:hypothetical protein
MMIALFLASSRPPPRARPRRCQASTTSTPWAAGWLLDLLGPGQSAFGFVTGATMANFTGLASDGQRRSLLPFSGLIPD